MFNYGIDKRVIYIVLIILSAYVLMSMSGSDIIGILLTLLAVIVAITFHEFAHAYTADKFGDTTPRNQGRLTLNPLSHLEPFGFILLVFANIGWGKPVQINPNNFVNSNKSRSFCEAMVSLAGPLMNFFIAIVACFAHEILKQINPYFIHTQMGIRLMSFLFYLIIIDIGLGVFNLIPLPPLDGEKIFKNVLPYRVQEWLTRNYYTLYWVFMLLWIFDVLGKIISPKITVIANELTFLVDCIIGFIYKIWH